MAQDGKKGRTLGTVLGTLFLSGCAGTVGLPLDAKFPDVPPEIAACVKRANTKLPDADMSAHDVEVNWKADRYSNVVLRQCLRRMIARDQTLAGKK